MQRPIKILQACGLSCDSEQYSQQECERFLEACDLYKKQSKSYQEIAAHFGVNFTGASQQNNVPDIIDSISDSAASSEAGLINLVDKVTEKRAENIPGLVNQMYLKNVARQLASSQDDIQSFYAGLEERILDQIEGKSPLSSIMGTNWETKPLQPSSEKPMQLPPESENGTRDE